jgi:hypothetical protein
MRSYWIVFVLLIGVASCNKETPRRHVKDMVGMYEGTWFFERNIGNTSEPGFLEIKQGSTKKTIYVGPEMVEIEMNANLEPIIIGNDYRLSFPDGHTDVIKFERFWDGTFADGKDEFYGYKREED